MKFKNPIYHLGKHDLIWFDLGTDRFKFSHAKISAAKKEIIAVKTLEMRGLSDEDISKYISSYILEKNLKDTELINIIPTNLSITKNIEIPSQDLQEIKEIIELQVGRYTPHSREEIIIDYINIGSYKKNYTKVLLVIVARSIVRRLIDISEKANLKVERILFTPELISLYLSRILKLEASHGPVSFIHIDSTFTDFITSLNGRLLFVRNIPIGILHLVNEKERHQTRFIEEVKRSIDSYQMEDIDKLPERIILTGTLEGTDELETLLNNSISIPSKAIKYLEYLQIPEEPLKEITSAKYTSYLPITSVFVEADYAKINLIPEEIKLRKTFEERSKELIRMSIYTMIVLALVLGILINKIFFKTLLLKNLTSKYQPIIEEVKTFEVAFSKVKAIKYFIAHRGLPLEVLSELYAVIPADIFLNNIKLAQGGRLSIGGKSQSMGSVFSFVSSMEDSKLFKSVKTKRTTKMKEADKELVDFEITCTLEETMA